MGRIVAHQEVPRGRDAIEEYVIRNQTQCPVLRVLLDNGSFARMCPVLAGIADLLEIEEVKSIPTSPCNCKWPDWKDEIERQALEASYS